MTNFGGLLHVHVIAWYSWNQTEPSLWTWVRIYDSIFLTFLYSLEAETRFYLTLFWSEGFASPCMHRRIDKHYISTARQEFTKESDNPYYTQNIKSSARRYHLQILRCDAVVCVAENPTSRIGSVNPARPYCGFLFVVTTPKSGRNKLLGGWSNLCYLKCKGREEEREVKELKRKERTEERKKEVMEGVGFSETWVKVSQTKYPHNYHQENEMSQVHAVITLIGFTEGKIVPRCQILRWRDIDTNFYQSQQLVPMLSILVFDLRGRRTHALY
jgi:hypothetical protein